MLPYVLSNLAWLAVTLLLMYKSGSLHPRFTRFPQQFLWGLGLAALPLLILAVINIGLVGQFHVFLVFTLPLSVYLPHLLFQLLVAVTEELFFRGWLLNLLTRKLHVEGAIFLTAILFTLLHMWQGIGMSIATLIIFFIGVLFATARVKGKNCSLFSLVLAHFLYNIAILS